MIKSKNTLLSALVIKPVLQCNANCGYCTSRLELHRQKTMEPTVSPDQWTDIFKEALELGVKAVHISGGEPMLYAGLETIVRNAANLALEINLNTNGTILSNQALISSLAKEGVGSITISLISHKAEINDSVKQIDNAFFNAVGLMNSSEKEGINVYVQTILLHDLLLSFDSYLEWLLKNTPAKALFVSYVEGPFGKWHPTENQILKFMKETLPKAEEVVLRHLPNDIAQNTITELRTLFRTPKTSTLQLAQGIYNVFGAGVCNVPRKQVLILANGDVHPCNAVEYFHEPVAGNVLKASLKDICYGVIYEHVRQNGTKWCSKCPIRHHVCLNFTNEQLLRGPTGMQRNIG